jgi:hypothetical protein
VTDDELAELEVSVEHALVTRDESRLHVLGYGEISLVLGWPPGNPVVACKRLPVFPSAERYHAYEATLSDYISALRTRGIDVIETQFRRVDRSDGIAAYVVQPAYPPSTFATSALRAAAPSDGHPLVKAIVDSAARAVGPTIGLDAQVSNWLWIDGRVRYLDVTTPMIWADDGTLRLDLELIVRPLPWVLRGPVRRFVAPRILDGYRHPRGVMMDICGNLLKERLDAWLPPFLDAANRHVEPAIQPQEVRRYYRSDARTWEFLLRMRRLDRAWQRSVRRRPYEFLLPGEVRR